MVREVLFTIATAARPVSDVAAAALDRDPHRREGASSVSIVDE
jgi:hypothetical protein